LEVLALTRATRGGESLMTQKKQNKKLFSRRGEMHTGGANPGRMEFKRAIKVLDS